MFDDLPSFNLCFGMDTRDFQSLLIDKKHAIDTFQNHRSVGKSCIEFFVIGRCGITPLVFVPTSSQYDFLTVFVLVFFDPFNDLINTIRSLKSALN